MNELEHLRMAINKSMKLLESIGIDPEADEEDASPSDMNAHVCGLVYKYLKNALQKGGK